MSFVREDSGGKVRVEHSTEMPDVPLPIEDNDGLRFPQGVEGPFQSQKVDILNSTYSHEHLVQSFAADRALC